jgi:hypothetical protein
MAGITSHVRAHILLVVIASALGSLLVIGTLSYHYLENWSWTQSFYFTVCTLTTVGYGDLYPTSDTSRIFTAIFALAGVAVAFGSFGALGTIYLRRGERILTRIAEGNPKREQPK